MRIGVVILPERTWAEMAPAWRRAEELGFVHAWTYDHIAWRELRDQPWFGAVPVLAAAALSTTRIRLGTLVASPNFRHPVPFARELLALDDLSGGRFTLGIGSGGTGWDATVLGQPAWPPGERASRFAEFVELTDLLLRQRETTFAGQHYSASAAPMWPGCVQSPRLPFAIAATASRGLAVVARHAQVWVSNGPRGDLDAPLAPVAGAEVFRRQFGLLEEACASAERPVSELDRLVVLDLRLQSGVESEESFRDTIGVYAAAGATDLVVHWPRASGPFAGDVDRFERVVSSVLETL